MNQKIKTVKHLRDDLIQAYEELRSGTLTLGEAKEISNISGKILSSAKVQLQYNVHLEKKTKIEFLDSDE